MEAAGDRPGDTGRDESEEERLDRNLEELLQELRVALPGVQVLFAFLLTVPFTQRFAGLSTFEETVYYGTLLCAAAASAFLIAPSAQHRIEFRQRDKRRLVFTGNRLAIVGLAFLAVAIAGVVALISHVLYGTTTTIVATGVTGSVLAWLWYAWPLRRRAQTPRERGD